jgi:hypothetical protein
VITDPGRVPLGRRAWIGNGRYGASVAPDGTIDWYASGGITAWPDLWRMLDVRGPAVRVGPVREGSVVRRALPPATMRYRAATNVVETILEAGAGRRVAVIDFAPWNGEGLVRLIRALSGPVDIEVEVLTGPPRRPTGAIRRVAPSGSGLLMDGLGIAGPGRFEPAPVDRDTERWRARSRLDAGEEAVVTIGFDQPLGLDGARRLLADTELAWRSWLGPLAYAGPYRAAVERALIGVRALTGPGGAPAGAGTTSLPRRTGSERATDGRWVRLRDAARAVGTLADVGLAEDAEAVETWLRQALSGAHVPWPAWLDADGQPVPEAEEWPLEGWRRSQPVVSGRHSTVDLGTVGPVLAAVGASMRGPGGRHDDPGPLSAAADALAEGTDWAADHWRQPDAGPWEIERPHRLYSSGRIEVLSALAGMARLARAANPLDLRAAGWQQEGGDILSWLESNAMTPDGRLRMDASPGASDEPDASLLAVAWSGPWPVTYPLVPATVDRVLERLASGPFLYRYSDRVADERAGPDHPDLEASLLAVRALAALGRWDQAHERMEAITGVVDRAGPGLLAETVDPVSGQLYGNFPSTAAGLALVDAALALVGGPR